MVTYPGTSAPKIRLINTHSEDKNESREICMGTHTGTHIDSQRHMIKGGKSIDKQNTKYFITRASILRLGHIKPGQEITSQLLSRHDSDIGKTESLLIDTQFWKYRKLKDVYSTRWPYLGEGAANYLAGFRLKIVGIDGLSIAQNLQLASDKDVIFSVHKILLKRGILILEETNFSEIEMKMNNKNIIEGALLIIPLKIKGSDASWVRPIFIVEDSQ